MSPTSIAGINRSPSPVKREIYSGLIPPELLARFAIPPNLLDPSGVDLLQLNAPENSPAVEIALRHQAGFADPILYGHLMDTLNGQIHVLLYILNDPASPRYDVDRLPDGRSTRFGTLFRNEEAELKAMQAGLAPGQIRRGLRMLANAIHGFENFIQSLSHELYFVEPLYYHNAVIFERYGFAYQQGRRLMERVNAGFSPGGDLVDRLNGSNPFLHPAAAKSVRLRSWAIHAGILGEPFDKVTMYKRIGKSANISTCTGCEW
jgi:hypothetical protein